MKGKNPFKDHRVRQALYQAIDIDAITQRVLRGFATPAALQVAPGVRGYDKALDVRMPFDPEKAKALLKEAGYPDGFGFTFDCTNNRYPGDAEMCTAIAAMWARIGVRAQVNAMPVQTFFPKVQRGETSMFLPGLRRRPSMRITAFRSRSSRPVAGRGMARGTWAATTTRRLTRWRRRSAASSTKPSAQS